MSDKIFSLIEQEKQRQTEMIGLIPSENHISPQVSEVLSSCLSSKYSEGYPGRRYYEGNQVVDEIEILAQERIKKLFDVPYVNVQPYSGSPANAAIYFALMKPGDTLMGLKLADGGHLTHGHPEVTLSGRFYQTVQYGLDKHARIDFDQLLSLAKKYRPQVIVAGTTAYPFVLEFDRFRQIADQVGAWLVADISHITGLVIGGQHPSPAPFADVIMSTTHKTFRGPRGAMIMVTKQGLSRDKDLPKKIDSAIIPGLQGGPHNATTAGIAIAAQEASTAKFKAYVKRIRDNADRLAGELQERGVKLVGGGTENHLMLIDLTSQGYGLGTQVAFALDAAGIYANRNTIPGEPCSPFYPSGLRIGTPLITTRGFGQAEMVQIADWIAQVIKLVETDELPEDQFEWAKFVKGFRLKTVRNKELLAIRRQVKQLAIQFPLFQW